MWQRLGSVALISLAAASSAMAPDLGIPTKAPPMAPPIPIYNWSGFYFGGNIGGGWLTRDETEVIPPPRQPQPGFSGWIVICHQQSERRTWRHTGRL
jgi:hypothetical protein